MERLEGYVDEESPFIERSNYKREPIQEEITNKFSELLQIVKENERILRAEEQLNQILMEIFQNEEKYK